MSNAFTNKDKLLISNLRFDNLKQFIIVPYYISNLYHRALIFSYNELIELCIGLLWLGINGRMYLSLYSFTICINLLSSAFCSSHNLPSASRMICCFLASGYFLKNTVLLLLRRDCISLRSVLLIELFLFIFIVKFK